jgi:hypothetical protein
VCRKFQSLGIDSETKLAVNTCSIVMCEDDENEATCVVINK